MKTFTRQSLLITSLVMVGLGAQVVDAEPQQPLAIVKELQVQQAQLADNQTKIETKIADLAETVRLARIYAHRSGGGHKPFIPPKP
jgi:hypothetical protein